MKHLQNALFTLFLAFAAFIGYMVYAPNQAEGTVFTQEGRYRRPFRILVGSGTAQTPWVTGLSTETYDNCVFVRNPGTTDLYVSTWADFADTDHYFTVSSTGGWWADCNSQTLYFRYANGQTSVTINGYFSGQGQP